MGSAVKIVTEDKNIAFSVKLKRFLEQVPHPDLRRTHNSRVVNVRHVVGYHRGRVMVRYQGGTAEIKLSEGCRDDFLGGLPGLQAD